MIIFATRTLGGKGITTVLKYFYALITRLMGLCLLLLCTEATFAQYNSRIRVQLGVRGDGFYQKTPYLDEPYPVEINPGWSIDYGTLEVIGITGGVQYLIHKNFSAGLTFSSLFIDNNTYHRRSEMTDVSIDTTIKTVPYFVTQTAQVQSNLHSVGLTGRYTLNPNGKVQAFLEANIGYGIFTPATSIDAQTSHSMAYYNGGSYYPYYTYEYEMNGHALEDGVYDENPISAITKEFTAGAAYRITRNVNLAAGISYLVTDIEYQVISEAYTVDQSLDHLVQHPFKLNFMHPFARFEIYFGRGLVKYDNKSKSKKKAS